MRRLDNVATLLSFQDSCQEEEERHVDHLRSLWHRRHFTMYRQWEKDVQKEWEQHAGVVAGTSTEIQSRLFGMRRVKRKAHKSLLSRGKRRKRCVPAKQGLALRVHNGGLPATPCRPLPIMSTTSESAVKEQKGEYKWKSGKLRQRGRLKDANGKRRNVTCACGCWRDAGKIQCDCDHGKGDCCTQCSLTSRGFNHHLKAMARLCKAGDEKEKENVTQGAPRVGSGV